MTRSAELRWWSRRSRSVRFPSTAECQQPPALPPDEVARAVVRADSAGDWATLIRLAHPDALVRFRGMQTFQLGMLGGTAAPGDDSLPADSTLQMRWQQERSRQERFLLDSVFRVPTVDSLAHTSPDTVFARWVRASQPAGRLHRHFRARALLRA